MARMGPPAAQVSGASMFNKARRLKEAGAKPGGGWVSKHPPRGQAAWKNSDTLEGLEKGSRVWHRAGHNAWVLGTLLAQQGASWSVALDSEAGEGTGPVRPALQSRGPTPCSTGVACKLLMHAGDLFAPSLPACWGVRSMGHAWG